MQCVLLFLVLAGNSTLFRFLRSLHALTLVARSYALLMHVIPHLVTTSVQLIRAGIGREASCTVVDCISSRLVSFPDLLSCTSVPVPRAWERDYTGPTFFKKILFNDCSCNRIWAFIGFQWNKEVYMFTCLCYSWARQARHAAKQNSPSAEGKGWFDPCWLHESWGRKTAGYLWPPTAWDSCHATT